MTKKKSEQLSAETNNRASGDQLKINEVAPNSQFFKPKPHENHSGKYSQLLMSLHSVLEGNSKLKARKKSFAHEAKVQIPRLVNKEDIASLYDLLNKLNTDFKKIRERRHFKHKGQYTDTDTYKFVVETIKKQTQKLVDNNPVLSQEQEEMAKIILGLDELKSNNILKT